MSDKTKTALFISILLNILFAGILAGGIFAGHRTPDNGQRGLGHHVQVIAGDLSPQTGRLFTQQMERVVQQEEDLHSRLKGIRENIFLELTAGEFDAARYLDQVTVLNELHKTRVLLFAETISHLAAQFSLADRKILARHLRASEDRPRPPTAP